jgi:hypothetical protein
MGYMRHHAVVVSSFRKEYAEEARQKAVELGMSVSELLGPVVNGYHSFFVGTDGSKEGWNDSNDGDKKRDALAAYLDSMRDNNRWAEWIEVQYGDDEGESAIIRGSDSTAPAMGDAHE